MNRRIRGNPNWGKPMMLSEIAPAVPTVFERLCEKLGLKTEKQQLASSQLKEWARVHYRVRYVPESLILKWGLAGRFELENAEI